ncbi:aminotransferase class V-fold PLP-dependent enzyme [Pacificimonas sp. WHA3]|uniref:Aminotransferase class V-fold PLP-dependent enzyme n=1 Tax=Pacificimonas pallii TaxID=2827236 RepID=A0ABS6SFD3_9SPHN|nr:aminotransferase class I/II-fold pyridoxal phosphate-dependent enzyme [Pacificimonas pallii]MBV7257120.1 aminotransferase class V-fold PLP-dependent enzyme [Pacificimonas pallii]
MTRRVEQEMANGAGTVATWGGEFGPHPYGASQVPIVLSAPFAYEDIDHWSDVALGLREGHIYSRNTNPTLEAFEEKVRLLEGGARATSFASGMAAISNTLFALLERGDRVVSVRDAYGGTSRILMEQLPRLGVDVTLVDTEDQEQLKHEILQGCKLVYLETPTNPTLKLVDLREAIDAAHAVGAITVVDNTFATPINQRPLKLGSDLVLHSATKFLGGHDDALGGVLVGDEELVGKVFAYREITGATLGSFAAYMLLRGLKTLELRVARQNENAGQVARMLAAHPKVDKVFHPSLDTHRGHDIAKRQMTGFGGVLSFSLLGGEAAIKGVLESMKLAQRAASLGAVNTLVGTPATTSHVECTAEQRAELGIPTTLIRYSCGIENAQDLIADLEQALQNA